MERFEVGDIVEVAGPSPYDTRWFVKEMYKYIGEKARITSRISNMYEVKFLNAGVQQIHEAELKDVGVIQGSWRFRYITLKKVMPDD